MDQFAKRLQKVLGARFRVLERIGVGGMSVVYRAHDIRNNREVAVKALREEFLLAGPSARFLQEIQITAKLSHPNILPLYDSDEGAGLVYYIMPYVGGGSLRDRLRRETILKISDAVDLTRQIASALDYAHQIKWTIGEGIVHRDIKPENILLDDGRVRVADFGIARLQGLADQNRLTEYNIQIGTPPYMSPEQCSGDQNIDRRSDVYSLACVVYEMLVGTPPFTGATRQAVSAKHIHEIPPTLRVVRQAIPQRMELAVEKALSKLPADRFDSAGEFAQAIADASRGSGDKTRESDRILEKRPRRMDGRDSSSVKDRPDRILRFPSARRSSRSSVVVAGPARTRAIIVSRIEVDSLAILPFANASKDSKAEYLSDGITESIINKLSSLPTLRVVPRSAVFRYKGLEQDFATVAKELRARAVVTGRVLLRNNILIVRVELIDVKSQSQIWGQEYQKPLSDIFAVQDAIATEIAQALRIELRADAQSAFLKRPTDSLPAYDEYLKGRYCWNHRTEEGLVRSESHLKNAIKRDPRFAVARASLAETYVTLAIYGVQAPREVMPQAMSQAGRALAMDPDLPQALAARGCARALFDWDWRGSETDFGSAIRLASNYPTAYQWYAINCLAPQGKLQEAHDALFTARLLDPVSSPINSSVGFLYYIEQDYERAIEEYLKVGGLDPTFPLAHYFLGLAYTELSQHDRALQALREAVRLSGNSTETVSALAYAAARAGDEEEVRRVRRHLETKRKNGSYVSPALEALIFIGLGKFDRSIQLLKKAIIRRATELVWLKMRPVYAPLRNHPGFRELLGAVKLIGSPRSATK